MKIVDQARLWFREGNSDKVYEIDLVEVVAGQHVVNFRYGRRGTTLRDGTKTPVPVALDKARAIYDALLAEKRRGGYQAIGLAPAPSDAAPVAPATPPAAPPADDHLLRALSLGHRGEKPLHWAVRRAGDRDLKAAEPMLLELLRSSPPPKGMKPDVWQHLLVGALARCGTSASVPALRAVADDAKARRHLREVARVALSIIDPAQLDVAALLPTALRAVLHDGAALAQSTESLLVNQASAGRDAVMALALLDTPPARGAVLAVARVARLNSPERDVLRALNRVAELRRDGELFTVLARRFETRGVLGAKRMLLYFRRRVARHLRRLASASSPDFARMATELLLSYHDHDAQPVVQSESGRWDPFARYHALNTILYRNSSRYEPAHHTSMTWRVKGRSSREAPRQQREEGWPALWDRAPELLWRLGLSDAAQPVIELATRALRAQLAFLAARSNDALADAMAAPHELMRRLGFEQARTRTHDLVLARGALLARLDEADAWVLSWVKSDPRAAVGNAGLLALLVTAPSAGVRDAAVELVRAHALDAAIGRDALVHAVAILMGVTDQDRAAGATATILRTLPLDGVGDSVIQDLLAHALPGVAELGGELLLRRARATALPAGLLGALLDSSHAHLRAIAARIIADTPPAQMKGEAELLAHFALSPAAEVREGTRALLAAVANFDAETGRAVAGLLLDALLDKLPEGAPAHAVSVLRRELRAYLPVRDPKNVLALLGALSPHAREAGGLLLPQLDADQLGLDDIARLASNEILIVRQGAWALATAAKDRFRVAPVALARLCDAKWEDSRSFAFDLVRTLPLSADAIISICDSTRPDVQAFGQALLRERWSDEHAGRYLVRLAEHPSVSMQLLVSGLLATHAHCDLQRLRDLEPYLRTVLSRPNRGGVAKHRVLDFLRAEAVASAEAAALLAPLLDRQSATQAVTHRAPLIATMVGVHEQFPTVPLPIRVVPPEGGDRGV